MVIRYEAPRLHPHFIQEWLDRLDITQKDLADRMETDPANINRWIREPHRVTLDIISGIADALSPLDPALRDAGNLLRHPRTVEAIESLRRSAQEIVETTGPRRRH